MIFLHAVNDIIDFPQKLGPGPQGYLRAICLSHLRKTLGLTEEEATQAVDIFRGGTPLPESLRGPGGPTKA